MKPVYPEELKYGQKPKIVVLSCSDSRIPGGIIFSDWKFVPGQYFEIRNAGNCYLLSKESFFYAVAHLKVEEVAIVGHNNCGMMKALIKGKDDVPEIQKAIDLIIEKVFGGDLPADDVDELAKENVHRQIELLLEEPLVKERYESGELKLKGYYYDFSKGVSELYLINENGKKLNERVF